MMHSKWQNRRTCSLGLARRSAVPSVADRPSPVIPPGELRAVKQPLRFYSKLSIQRLRHRECTVVEEAVRRVIDAARSHRTAPLGIVMLAPVVVVIFLFHVVLTGNWPWGTLNLAWIAGLGWRYRRGFTALWTYPKSR